MKNIEKITRDGDIQQFDIIENRKELRSWVRDIFWDSKYSEDATGVFEDEDSVVHYYDKSGNYHGFSAGDAIKGLRISQISRFVWCNSCSEMVYGNVPIVYNEEAGYWEAVID